MAWFKRFADPIVLDDGSALLTFRDAAKTVPFDQYLADLSREISAASASPERALSISVDAAPLAIPNDIAVPLGLIVNELLTIAIQHSRPIAQGEPIRIAVSSATDRFSVSVSDSGQRT
jgi:two-component sensor histidine kinase